MKTTPMPIATSPAREQKAAGGDEQIRRHEQEPDRDQQQAHGQVHSATQIPNAQ